MSRSFPLLKLAPMTILLLLGACGKSASPAAGSTASGEILPGSVSDAMLDTDRSQAEPPLAPAAHRAAAKADASAGAEASSGAVEGADGTAPVADDPTPPKSAASPKASTP